MQEYFTIKEAANHLKYSEDQVFRVMQPGRPGAMLSPAFVVGSPLDAKDRKTGKRCRVSPGVYEIGVHPFTTWIDGNKITFRVLEWDKDGFAYVNELTSYKQYEQPAHISMALYTAGGSNRRRNLAYGRPEVIVGCESLAKKDEFDFGFSAEELAAISEELKSGRWPDIVSVTNRLGEAFVLWAGGWMRARIYKLVGDPITVSRTQLVIQRWSLVSYMLANGFVVPEDLLEPQPIFDPNKYVEKRTSEGVPREIVAVELYNMKYAHKELTKKKIAELMTAGSSEKSATEKRGSRLIAAGVKMRGY